MEVTNAKKQIEILQNQTTAQRHEINKLKEAARQRDGHRDVICQICTESSTEGVCCSTCGQFHCKECEKKRKKMEETKKQCFFCKSNTNFHEIRF